MTEAVQEKETKAQKAERLKREKNPWAAFDEVRSFARQGRESVLPEWGSTYFKWWGIYTQGDGVGATGGKGGEGLTSEYFMMRIGIPNGIISSSQLRAIGGLTRKYARNLADITVRQNIQIHWLTIESLPEIVDALDAIGLSPKGACRRCGPQRDRLPAGRSSRRRVDRRPRRLPQRSRNCSREIRIFITCRANSKSPSPAVHRGARTRRSTTLLSRPLSTMARLATRCAWVEDYPRNRTWPFASMRLYFPIRPSALRVQ